MRSEPAAFGWFGTRTLTECKQPSPWKGSWQLINIALPYGALLFLMYLLIRRGDSYGFTLMIGIIASVFLVCLHVWDEQNQQQLTGFDEGA